MARLRLVPLLALALATAMPARALEIPPLATSAATYGFNRAAGLETYPDADALVLLESNGRWLDERQLLTVRVHRIVKVLRGTASAEALVRFSAPVGANLDFAARTTGPRGEVTWVAGSDFVRETLSSKDPLSRAIEVVSFAFPNVEPGSFLEHSYTYAIEQGSPVDVDLLDGPHPVQVAFHSVSFPLSEPLRIEAFDAARGKLVASSRSRTVNALGRDLMVDTIVVRDLPAVPREPQSLHEISRRSHVSVTRGSGGDASLHWDALADAITGAIQGTGSLAQQERTQAFRNGRIDMTVDARIAAILSWLRGKVRIETQRRVSRSSAGGILESGVVDPAEFCLLLATALRGADVKAYLGLVNSRDNLELDRRVPWSGFLDRVVVVALGQKKTYFLDPLSPDIDSGVARADCQGRTLLMGRAHSAKSFSEGAEARFFEVPYAAPETNRIELRASLRPLAVPPAVRIEERHEGEPAWELHDYVRQRGTDPLRSAIAVGLGSLLPGVDWRSVAVQLPSRRTAEVRASGDAGSLLWTGASVSVLDLRPFSAARELRELASPPPSGRTTGIDLGYARSWTSTVDVELTAASAASALAQPASVQGPGMRYSQQASRTGTGIKWVSTLTIDDPRIERSELPAFQTFLGEIARAEAHTIPLPALPR